MPDNAVVRRDRLARLEEIERIYQLQDIVLVGLTSLPPRFGPGELDSLMRLPGWRAVMFARLVHLVAPSKFSRAQLDQLIRDTQLGRR